MNEIVPTPTIEGVFIPPVFNKREETLVGEPHIFEFEWGGSPFLFAKSGVEESDQKSNDQAFSGFQRGVTELRNNKISAKKSVNSGVCGRHSKVGPSVITIRKRQINKLSLFKEGIKAVHITVGSAAIRILVRQSYNGEISP